MISPNLVSSISTFSAATDLSALNQTILRLIQLEGAEFKAADLDDSERITATDLSTENNAILKNITLTYNKPNNAELQG